MSSTGISPGVASIKCDSSSEEVNDVAIDDKKAKSEPKSTKGAKARLRKIFGNEENGLHRKLKSRHQIMLSVGGTIGTGLFLSSGQGIAIAGPASALVAYFFMGFFVFSVVFMLGEMSTAFPISGGFGAFAARFISPSMGFTVGMNFFFQLAVSIPSECIATAILVKFWLPHTPSAMWISLFLGLVFIVQLIDVRVYGEIEYFSAWFKVVLIIVFLIISFLMMCGAFPSARHDGLGVTNITSGPFIGGFAGFIQALVFAFYSFGGAEYGLLTSAETQNPQKNIPRTVKLVSLRLILFNMLSIFAIGMLINHKDPRLVGAAETQDVQISPFTIVLKRSGITPAVHIVNAILVTAVLSAMNSTFYSATRMLVGMSKERVIHSIFGYTTKHGIPVVSNIVVLILSCTAFLAVAWGDGQAFVWLQNLVAISGVITWTSTGIMSIRFRQALKRQNVHYTGFRQFAYPLLPIIVFAFGAFIFIGQGYASTKWTGPVWRNVLATYSGVFVFIIMYVGYCAYTHDWTIVHKSDEVDLVTGSLLPKPGVDETRLSSWVENDALISDSPSSLESDVPDLERQQSSK